MSWDAMDMSERRPMDMSERHPMDVSERHPMDVSERYHNLPPATSSNDDFDRRLSERSNISTSTHSDSHLIAHLSNNSSETTSHESLVMPPPPAAVAAAPPPAAADDQPPPPRRRPSTSSDAPPPPLSQLSRRTSMSEIEQANRRASIKRIMADRSLTQIEKRRSIQCLMDGRKKGGRRSTIDSGMTNPYLAYKAAQRKVEVRRTGSFLRRSSSSNNVAADAGEEDDLNADDLLPITSNTRHFAAAAAAAASRITTSTSTGGGGTTTSGTTSLSNSLHGDNNIDNSIHSTSAYSNNISSHSYQHHPLRGMNPDDNGSSDDDSSSNSSNLLSAFLQKKHPYNATTTKVPAVAADASNNNSHLSKSFNYEFAKRAIEMAPKCTHYTRNCHIIAPCCGATFGCRICHDDCPVLPPLLEQKMPPPPSGPNAQVPQMCYPVASPDEEGGDDDVDNTNTNGSTSPSTTGRRKYQRVLRTSSMPTSFPQDAPPEHHNVDRFAIREIICRKCFKKQGSKTNNCVNCGVQLGEYHCAICNLWMSNEERPYHCPDCGFCRVGGGENFRHCQDCGMCIDKTLFQDHNCKVGKYMSNCPVCQEDLFSSRDASHELPCGHAIHWHCFRELASHDSRCPMCKKTAETHERMKPTWDAMAMGIALQPVPPELAKVVTIKCNDCEVITENRSWHFLGVRCNECESFNTVVEKITMIGQEAHEFLLRMDMQLPQLPAGVGGFAAGTSGGGGGGDRQQRETSTSSNSRPSRPRPARRRRATVDSAVNPARALWEAHQGNDNVPER